MVSNALIFQIDIKTVYLKAEFSPKVFFPHQGSNTFSFTSDVGDTIISLTVHGLPSFIKRPIIHQEKPSRSFDYRFVRTSKKAGPSGTYSLKVMRAEVSRMSTGKISLENSTTGQTFILLDETTANVDFINCEVQKVWGKKYIIVTGNGLPIEDSSGTQGTTVIAYCQVLVF